MAYKGKATDGTETADGEFTCKIWQGTQGKQFEVAMVAYFHAMHEFAEKDEFEIIDIQRNRSVKLLDPETDEVLSSFRRDYDIVLKGNDTRPIIVELKSAQAKYTRDSFDLDTFMKRFPRWSVTRTNRQTGLATKTTVHRQLLLDAVASVPVEIPGQDAQQHASDYVWLWQDWAEPREKTISRRRDPGVSIWKQTSAGKSAGDHLRERLRAIGYDKSAREIIQKTLGVNSTSHLLPLSERVADLKLKRFGKLDWRSLIEAPQDDGVSLKDRFYEQLDEDTEAVLREVELAQKKVISVEQHIDDAAEYLREALARLIPISKPEWLEEAEKTLRDLEEKKEEILDEIDNETLNYLVPDDIVNNCL